MQQNVNTPLEGADEDFAAMFEASISAGDFGKEGEIVQGTVVTVQRDNVIIDIGGKSEGMISVSEFTDATGQVTVKAGDRIVRELDDQARNDLSFGTRLGAVRFVYRRLEHGGKAVGS